MTFDRDAARARAEKQVQKINSARDALRENDDPKAETYQADALAVAQDVLALLDAPAAVPPSALAVDTADAYAALAKRMWAIGTVCSGMLDLLDGFMPPESQREFASFLLVVPQAAIDPDRVQQAVAGAVGSWPTDPANPRQAVVPRSIELPPVDGGTQSAATAPAPTGTVRAAEQDIEIESWNPSTEDLAALPGAPGQKLENLAAFKAANKGKSAKRWKTSFTAYHRSALLRAPAAQA